MTADVLTVKETAALLKISERHLRTLTKAGAVPKIEGLGDCVRYCREVIERLIAGKGRRDGQEK